MKYVNTCRKQGCNETYKFDSTFTVDDNDKNEYKIGIIPDNGNTNYRIIVAVYDSIRKRNKVYSDFINSVVVPTEVIKNFEFPKNEDVK